jgi:hypothetical protein
VIGPAEQRLLAATRAVSWRMGYETNPESDKEVR